MNFSETLPLDIITRSLHTKYDLPNNKKILKFLHN